MRGVISRLFQQGGFATQTFEISRLFTESSNRRRQPFYPLYGGQRMGVLKPQPPLRNSAAEHLNRKIEVPTHSQHR